MPYNGSGTFSPPAAPAFPAVGGSTIFASYYNQVVTDIHNGLTNALTKDGQTTPTANLPMGGKKLTALAAGSAAGDSVRYEQAALLSGANTYAANQPMGGFKLTGLGAGTTNGDSVRYEQLTSLQNSLTALNDELIGVILPWPSQSANNAGWLKCNGQPVSRTTYAKLFAKIGTNFGAGDGSTTFNLPDIRGRWVRGWDDGKGIDTGRVAFTTQASAVHSHTHTFTTGAAGAHAHQVAADNYSSALNPVTTPMTNLKALCAFSQTDAGNDNAKIAGTSTAATIGLSSLVNDHTHTGTTDATGTGATETRVDNIAFPYFIKAL